MAVMPPILVAPLLREVCQRLHDLLKSLDANDWHKPTSSSRRLVRDIVSHLLDGSLRRLSMQRDGYLPPARQDESTVAEPLLDYLNRLNAEWEQATRRLSPTVLVGLLEWADSQFADLMESLDPFGPAIFPVAWAGEESSQNWFDVARDYTEKWHHTQQIFEAVGRPSTIMARRLYHPCLDTFMRALPFTFRDVEADVGSTVAVEVIGEAGGAWHVVRRLGRWEQSEHAGDTIAAKVTLPQEIAWKVFTKRRSVEATLAMFPEIRFDGDRRLGEHGLSTVSVMA